MKHKWQRVRQKIRNKRYVCANCGLYAMPRWEVQMQLHTVLKIKCVRTVLTHYEFFLPDKQTPTQFYSCPEMIAKWVLE